MNSLLQDFATAVLKIKGLAKLLAGNVSGQSFATRAQAMELARSIAKITVLDAEFEEYSRQSTNLTGLAEVIEQLALRLAAAADMPVSLLMGQSPAGLNATGEANTNWFFDQVKAKQKFQLLPALTQLTRTVFLSKDGPTGGKEPENWSIEFRPLKQMTEKEHAEIREIQSRIDVAYITAQVVTSQEIAKSRFGGDAYSTNTEIDIELRDEMLADTELQEKELGVSGESEAEDARPTQEQAQVQATEEEPS